MIGLDEVETNCLDAHEQLALRRRRDRDLLEAEDLAATGLVDADGLRNDSL